MDHVVIGLRAAAWHAVIEGISGHGGWVFLESVADYRPRPHDRVIGFFTLSQVQWLQRLQVEVWAFTCGEVALPDAHSAWALRHVLGLSRVQPVVCGRASQAQFDAGPESLLRATFGRRGPVRRGPLRPARTQTQTQKCEDIAPRLACLPP